MTSHSRSSSRRRSLYGVLLAAAVVALATACASAETPAPTPSPTPQVTPTDGCCAKCIGKTTDLPYTYDPLVFSECSAAKGICCYNCGQDAASQMSVTNANFGDDGVTPQIKAGEWAIVQWASVARVTYETYRDNQKKTTTVRNGSNEARLGDDGNFYICAKTHGYMYARGWGKDPCVSATKENKITILNGTDVDSCGNLPSSATAKSNTPAVSSGSTSKIDSSSKKNSSIEALNQNEVDETCNTDRASVVVKSDGTKECVCAAEWAGPPSCGDYPWWKIAATVGGAVAAVLSIIVSVRAYLGSRKSRSSDQGDDAVLGASMDDVPIVRGGSSPAVEKAVAPPRRPSHEDYEQHRSTKADAKRSSATQAREFSL
ncbi:hypothetical protein Gpo141_00004600 [Globisporangium polare]